MNKEVGQSFKTSRNPPTSSNRQHTPIETFPEMKPANLQTISYRMMLFKRRSTSF